MSPLPLPLPLDMSVYRDRLEDEIACVKESYFAMVKLCYETETWQRILRGHIKCLGVSKLMMS